MKYLSKFSFLCCAVFLLSSSVIAFAQSTDKSQCAKHYVSPKSVQVTPKGIFVDIDGKTVAVKELKADKNGKVFIPKKVTYITCPWGHGTYTMMCEICYYPYEENLNMH
jgi:hypothetical protein